MLSHRNREAVLAPVIERAIVRLIRRVQWRSARRDPTNVIARRSQQLDRVATRLDRRDKKEIGRRERERFAISRLIPSLCYRAVYGGNMAAELWIVKRRSMTAVKHALEFVISRASRSLPNMALDLNTFLFANDNRNLISVTIIYK